MDLFNLKILKDIRKKTDKYYKKIKKLKPWYKYPIYSGLLLLFLFCLWLTGIFGNKIDNFIESSIKKDAQTLTAFDSTRKRALFRKDSIFQKLIVPDSIQEQSGAKNYHNTDTVGLHGELKSVAIKEAIKPIISMNFFVNGIQGIINSEYKSYDEIELKIGLGNGKVFFLLLVNIDADGIHPIGDLSLEPFSIHERVFETSFYLDKVRGNELIYAIVSLEKFEYKDIQSILIRAEDALQQIKGTFKPMSLPLPSSYNQSVVYFSHE